jgi:hypothetical protein
LYSVLSIICVLQIHEMRKYTRNLLAECFSSLLQDLSG